jgi:hypothetical protein
MADGEIQYKMSITETEMQRRAGRPKRRWEDGSHIKMYLGEIRSKVSGRMKCCYCEHGNEHLDTINCVLRSRYPSDSQPLKKPRCAVRYKGATAEDNNGLYILLTEKLQWEIGRVCAVIFFLHLCYIQQ